MRIIAPSTAQGPTVPQKFECSRENALALVEITFAYVDTLLWEINRYNMYSKLTLRIS